MTGRATCGRAVYPRVCGGNNFDGLASATPNGLSPRVRGKREGILQRPRRLGSIPACAGETNVRVSPEEKSAVYPRVCGGNDARAVAMTAAEGLSPRVRGKPPYAPGFPAAEGSIPACAGETRSPETGRRLGRVYPRVCGGNQPSSTHSRGAGGLSPRVRGKPFVVQVNRFLQGSIPACAGETEKDRSVCRHKKVYPRVCGGNFRAA